MGIVYLARDVHAEIPVVVKSIRAELAHNPELRARTLAEGRALARIDHPNVVRLNAVVVEARDLYLVMQFIDGESLDQLIARHVAARTPMPLALVLSIFRMVLRGVGAAHAEGLIHRDLKPANILVRAKDGVAKVTDFGIAKVEEDAKAGRGVTKGIIGSLSYMAPEQVRGQRDLDKRVDIYALGIVLFELLVGRPPFDAPSDYELMRMHTETPLPSVSQLRRDVPSAIDPILQHACAKDRTHRFATTDEFLAALEILGDAQPAPPLGAGIGRHPMPANPVTELATHPPFIESPPFAAAGGSAAPARIATGDGAAIPFGPRPSRRTGLWIAVSLGTLALAAGAGTVLYLGGSQPSAPTAHGNSAGPSSAASTRASSASATSLASAAPASTRASPLTALAGHWRSTSNRDYAAVLAGDLLEFRIQKASQHPRQGYQDGDVRFELAPVQGSSTQFTVRDHIRPTPPPGYDYDPKSSRDSCIGNWTEIQGRPLGARFDGASTLSVDFAQIRTSMDKFKVRGKLVVGCAELASSPALPIESQLSRVD
jgi:serine/threonine-protein kinase